MSCHVMMCTGCRDVEELGGAYYSGGDRFRCAVSGVEYGATRVDSGAGVSGVFCHCHLCFVVSAGRLLRGSDQGYQEPDLR